MAAALELRDDFTGDDLRRLARSSRDAKQVRRLLALSAVRDGGSRTEAARIGGVCRSPGLCASSRGAGRSVRSWGCRRVRRIEAPRRKKRSRQVRPGHLGMPEAADQKKLRLGVEIRQSAPWSPSTPYAVLILDKAGGISPTPRRPGHILARCRRARRSPDLAVHADNCLSRRTVAPRHLAHSCLQCAYSGLQRARHYDAVAEAIVRPGRFFSAPASAPRTVCGCQPVASTTSRTVAPSGHCSMAISAGCLVAGRVLPRSGAG